MQGWFSDPRRQALSMVLVLAFVFTFAFGLSRWLMPSKQDLTAQPNKAMPPSNALTVAEQLQRAFAWVAKKVIPSTVTIMAPRPLPALRFHFRFPPFPRPEPFREFEEFFRRFFERGIPSPQGEGEREQLFPRGSGFIVRADGFILTNHHVIKDADRIVVVLHNGHRFKAEVIGVDKFTDIALLKIDPGNVGLIPATLGDSDEVKVCDWVIAIGNPFGLRETVTVGVVSAIGRHPGLVRAEVEYTEFIQTDAAINQGNSGGPLCNIRGEVIGINTAIFSPTGGSVGIGFAIPINTAKFVMEQILEHGQVIRGWLGVTIQGAEMIEDPTALGLKEARGAVVMDVLSGSPAEKAGLKPQDVIVAFNGIPIRSTAHLQSLVGRTPPGTTVKLTVIRGGKELIIPVRVGKYDERVALAARGVVEWRGIRVQNLTPALRRQIGLPQTVKGVIVTQVRPDSPAAKAGLREGDVITVIANREVISVDGFQKVVGSLPPERSVPVTVRRPDGVAMVIVPPER